MLAYKAPNMNNISPSCAPNIRRWNQRRPRQRVLSYSPFEPGRTLDVEAQPSTSQGEGGSTLHGPASRAAESLVSAINSTVREEQYKAEAVRQRLLERLRSLRGEAPPSLAAVEADELHDDEAESRPRPQPDEEGGVGLQDRQDAAIRAPWLTWLLTLTTVAVFAIQWAPLVPVLLDGASRLDPGTLLAFLLVLPDTSWKMVRAHTLVDPCREACTQRVGGPLHLIGRAHHLWSLPALPACRMS